MIGHTGNMEAAIKTVKAVDVYAKKVYQAALKHNANLIITADHGNIECKLNVKTGEIMTEHTTNPVPLIMIGDDLKKSLVRHKNGVLGNVAPTILEIFGEKKPREMSKNSLV
jgi:2,3-bisphosphoglycerate-independent phosphoglycerate mutase